MNTLLEAVKAYLSALDARRSVRARTMPQLSSATRSALLKKRASAVVEAEAHLRALVDAIGVAPLRQSSEAHVHCCQECGVEVGTDGYCHEHPNASVASVLVNQP